MGILNITPDSFYAASRQQQVNELIEQARLMIGQGADILDIGGQSTRPGAALVEAAEESHRVIPALKALRHAFPHQLISIDTFYASVARQAIDAGVDIINDVSGGTLDSDMWDVLSNVDIAYILMHMRGTPQTMTQFAHYKNLVPEVIGELAIRLQALRAKGVRDVIIDPGFGFAKTIEQNYRLLAELEAFQILDAPLLVGVSRKGMIWKTLESTAERALNGTTILNTIALQKGTAILRVHDVVEAREAVTLLQKLAII